ncbi:MAG: adenylyl-sulfate kinase [Promethearchaeota archaeon]|nr:MAG: adenylyl-sulfate kinase [Candidatus Lokiarchaeota archaeon]
MRLMAKQIYLIILSGLPASGKSTFARSFASVLELNRTEVKVKIIDPDKIRKKLYSGIFNHKKENLVRKKHLREIEKALKKGFITISDDLNYYTSMRHDLKAIADRLQIPFYIIHISTPLTQCIAWNEKRGKPIPNEVLQNIEDKFDLFNTYSWDKPFSSFNLLEIANLETKLKSLREKIEQDINLQLEQSHVDDNAKVNNQFNESLDQVTRKIVKRYVKDLNNDSLRTQILNLRKAFVKRNLYKKADQSEIANNFIRFLKEQLKDDEFNS